MKTQLLIALTCPSVAFADRGNDFSNGTFGSGGYTFQSLPEWLSEYRLILDHRRTSIDG